MSRPTLAASAVLALTLTSGVTAGPPQAPDLERAFTTTVRPFLEAYCVACHGGSQPAAQFNLSKYAAIGNVVPDLDHWSTVLTRLNSGTMPPRGAKQPDADARKSVVAWITALRNHQARKNAGDPGVVLARRLSNAEYDYTVRDLTGADIRPAREFPVDPANQAGFDNSGESLAMSPSLLNKYLQAAREVANHLVLKPTGIAFAPHPALAETDRDKYCVNQIVDFYHRQDTDYADYFQAAWRFKHRADLGKPRATLAEIAADAKVSPKYLATVWSALEGSKETIGPVAKLQSMWRELPADANAVRPACERMRDWVVQLRAKIELRFPDLSVAGISRTAQPFLMWRNRQYATHRRDFDRGALQVEGEAQAAPTPALRRCARASTMAPSPPRRRPAAALQARTCTSPPASASRTKPRLRASPPSSPTASTSRSAAATSPTPRATRAASSAPASTI
jgi:mono/diheme cytochrome c family protein